MNTAHDLVSEIMLGMRLLGVTYRRTQVTKPFGLRFDTHVGRAQFHFVAEGTLFLRGYGADPIALRSGDALLMPRGGPHDLVSTPDEPSRPVESFTTKPLCENISVTSACVDETGQHRDALIFSACMDFDLGGMRPLIDQMPDVMQVDDLLNRQPEIRPMLHAMERETCQPRAGSVGITARLADVVAASIVRDWIECNCRDGTGWFVALHDPRLGRAIAALHRNPSRDWTVADLATEAGTSRSVFADRFQAIVGQPPLRYATDLRMRLAAQWLERDRMSIDKVAERLGYASQAAFSRAFKRSTGQSPGARRGKNAASD
ncbi:MAG TPA: AraC family transcriptional regulator [Beijerinckiaceae bacterium]|nr:AraC family transcriptional regulator [Beijerinckiaceae bacterium]